MAKGLVVYYSRSGNTEEMARVVAKGMNDAGLITKCQTAEKTSTEDLLEADAIVVGSPTYYGQMAAEVKKVFDDAVDKHGQLDGKVGGAFSSSANIGGGNETTVIGIIEAMLIHGMIVQGDAQGDHYGPISIGKPDERAISQCEKKAIRIVELTKKLFG